MTADLSLREALNQVLRADLAVFVRRVFLHLNPRETLIWNWHVNSMCQALGEVRRGENRRLLMTVPPRHLKSITVSVAFVAWAMGHDPSLKFLVASYGGELASQLARSFQSVVGSPWYQAAFPEFGKPRRDADGDLVTQAGGHRKAVSVGGATTGFGADCLIVDDLMKATDATSPATRDATLDYFRGSLISRLNNQALGRIIVIAQRLHEDDLPGHCIESGLYKHLNFPAIAQRDEAFQIGPEQFHSRAVGDLLFPAFQSRAVLDGLKLELGSAFFSAQYLQDPTPAENDLIRWHDIQRYAHAPPRRQLEKVVQSWDTAETASAHSDYSACSTWGWYRGKWLLLDMLRVKANFRDLADRARTHRDHWKADYVLIEDAGSGRHLLTEFNHERRTAPENRPPRWVVHRCLPTVGKLERWAAQAAKLETGVGLFPKDAPWLEALRREVTGFPNAKHDDQVDCIAQFLAWTSKARVAIGLKRAFQEEAIQRPSDNDDDEDEVIVEDWFRNGRQAPTTWREEPRFSDYETGAANRVL